MNNRTLLTLASIFLLVGCDTHRQLTGQNLKNDEGEYITPGTPLPPEPELEPTHKLIVLFGGQSNTDAVYINGSANFYAALAKQRPVPISRIHSVHCAQGGTNASDWVPGMPLFESCVQQILSIQQAHPGAVLWGMAWVQGENEAETCADWKNNFESMISSLKSRTNSPDMAVVWERINNAFDTHATCLAKVRSEQEIANVGPRGRFVDTDGIPLSADNVHYYGAPESAEELGRRYGETLGPLLK